MIEEGQEWTSVFGVWRSSLMRRFCEEGRIRLEKVGVWVAPAEISWGRRGVPIPDPASCWEWTQRGPQFSKSNAWHRTQPCPFPGLVLLCTHGDQVAGRPCTTIIRENEAATRLYVVDAQPLAATQGTSALVFGLGEPMAEPGWLAEAPILLAIVALGSRSEEGEAPAPVSGPLFSHAPARTLAP